ncbi:putative bifunctional diguanylate cyclase/phosphodiesterase [Actinoplanes friuliensis]|uniref:Diguanylate cyclase n=1 Tax=Actinoplanes friuliensis DSM 7358 TaxID=1246995 RepID=U5W652_9ACTN|nr:EAL domain-containing protein [Actinoplanes friuliensis]AGZ44487.1 diguanylate cyclase [Actinoplanes friuliensis DSM 7358]
MASRRRAEPRALTSWRVLLAVVVVLTATVVAGVAALQEQIRTRTLDSAVQGVVIISSLVIDRSLTLNDLVDELHPANRAQLDTDLVLLRQRGEVRGLMIWSLTDGRLVYADPDYLLAGRLTDARRRSVPLDHPTAGNATDPATGEHLLEVNYPYDANGDGIVDGLAVMLLPRRDVDSSIARATRLLYGGGLVVLVIALAAVLQVRRRQSAQDHAAVHDPLTGLGNREKLRRVAAPALTAASERHPAALLLLDLNGFKGINDSLGHHAGDQVLTAVARRLEQICPGAGTVIRLGGDEFAVLLPRTGSEQALAVAAAAREAVSRPVVIEGLAVEVGASIGVATAPVHGRELSAVLQQADIAMYRAKKAGGGVLLHDETAGTDETGSRHVTQLAQLRQALEDGLLELYYQPTFAATGEVRDLEALLRWNHPQYGLLAAADFLVAVEQTAMIKPLTAWMLRTATAQGAAWYAAGHRTRIVVNLAAQSLLDDTLPALVIETAAAAGLPLEAISLEFSEATVALDPPRAATALARLAAAGIAVGLDNVGAGTTHWLTVARAPLTRLKLDRELVRLLPGNLAAERIVGGLIRIAGDLGMTSVAVGVETPGTVHRLTELGCDELQGFALCRPLPAGEVSAWLSDHSSIEVA